VLIGAPFREDVWGSGGIALRIINTFGSVWRWPISITFRAALPPEG